MKTTLTVVVLLAFASLIGCKSKPKSEPYTGPAAPVTTSELNAAKLTNAVVPQAVQTAFGHDHPNAVINDIAMQSTSAGDSFYVISFMSKGQPGVARYFTTGKPLPAN